MSIERKRMVAKISADLSFAELYATRCMQHSLALEDEIKARL
jgi:hypothetical protein